jgi:hypothetical protein
MPPRCGFGIFGAGALPIFRACGAGLEGWSKGLYGGGHPDKSRQGFGITAEMGMRAQRARYIHYSGNRLIQTFQV